MAGHVDEAETDIFGELQVREAEVDGDAAALLFGKAVRVRAGERFDESCLTVVDVTGGANDDISNGCRGVTSLREQVTHEHRAHFFPIRRFGGLECRRFCSSTYQGLSRNNLSSSLRRLRLPRRAEARRQRRSADPTKTWPEKWKYY